MRIHPTQLPYTINNKRYFPLPSSIGYSDVGIASWYGEEFHERTTSNGEIFDMFKMTAAHKTLPMNTMLMVENLQNGRRIVVRVNDRGPFVRKRIIDLSYVAARELGMVDRGVASVRIAALAEEKGRSTNGDRIIDYRNLRAGKFYVQIGAFGDRTNALRLQKRFIDAGHTTVINDYPGPESTFYRVQVYAGSNLASAKKAEEALLDRGYTDCFIIAR
ncbi:septal ring lytic transglycosylase RlpA family protein [Desulforhopalus singaporensis]|nr:septal ring lytic transglycosylase RlpA family protein [Desulforhopalus singaporensis]